MENVQESCGCCEIDDYDGPVDEDDELACKTCGHSPEEHEPDNDESGPRPWTELFPYIPAKRPAVQS